METLISKSTKTHEWFTEKYRENRTGAGMSPYLTQLSIKRDTECEPLKLTRAFIKQWNCTNQLNSGGKPNLPWMVDRAVLLTVPKTLVKSTNTWWKTKRCSLHFSWSWRAEKIMPIVPWPDLKKQWLSEIIEVHIYFVNLLRKSFVQTWLTNSSWLMPL